MHSVGPAGVAPGGRSRGARGTSARVWRSVSGALALASSGAAHALAGTDPLGPRGSSLGTGRLPAHCGPVLRPEERTWRGRTLVSTHVAGSFLGRVVGED